VLYHFRLTYSYEQGLSLLSLDDNDMRMRADEFPCNELDLEASLPPALQVSTACSTARDLTLHKGIAIALRCIEDGPTEARKEATMRELISPILFTASALSEDIRVLTEHSVDGTRAGGTIDWVLLCRRFSIVVVEVSW
jgi:hypothetical protein